jgi:hypothetical protein
MAEFTTTSLLGSDRDGPVVHCLLHGLCIDGHPGVVEAPHLYHVFWYSYGTSLPKGPIVTVRTTIFVFVTSAIALFVAWVAPRVWRILDALVICERTKASMQESQCSLAPDASPFSRYFRLPLSQCSFILILLRWSVPVHNGGFIAATDCGYFPIYIQSDCSAASEVTRFADAGLSSTARSRSKSTKAISRSRLPVPTQSYVRRCPMGVSCHPVHLLKHNPHLRTTRTQYSARFSSGV